MTPPAVPQAASATTGAAGDRMLVLGAIAGPLFVVSSLAQAALRTGFDLREHPPSALALGEVGWIQSATFVAAGLCFFVGAYGLARTMEETGTRWAPRFIGVFGLALVAGGIFTMDPAFGFPPGVPDGVGDTVSWHAVIHGVMFPLGFAAIVIGSFAMARHYALAGRRFARWASIAAGPVALLLATWPTLGGSPDGRFLPMWAGVVVAFGWTSAVLADAAREHVITSTGRTTAS